MTIKLLHKPEHLNYWLIEECGTEIFGFDHLFYLMRERAKMMIARGEYAHLILES